MSDNVRNLDPRLPPEAVQRMTDALDSIVRDFPNVVPNYAPRPSGRFTDDEACPRCHHVHLGYWDEECVSCGFDAMVFTADAIRTEAGV